MEGEGGRERKGEWGMEGEGGGEGGGGIYRRRENGVWSHICTQASTHTHTHARTHTPRSHYPSTPLLPQLAHSTGSPLQGYTALLVLVSSMTVEYSTYLYIYTCTCLYTVHVYNTCIVWAPYTYLHCTLCGKYV